MATGSEHVLALFGGKDKLFGAVTEEDETEVWGWGWNEHGNLGVGTTDDIRLPTQIWPGPLERDDRLGTAVGVWAGCGTSWIALEI
jgi:protein ATS1